MAESDVLSAVKALHDQFEAQFESQTVSFHRILQQYMSTVDSRLEEFRSQFRGSSRSSMGLLGPPPAPPPVTEMGVEAFTLARAYETRCEEIKQSARPWHKWSSSNAANTSTLPTPALPIRRLTPTELREKREKGLCYNCDQKYFANHRCRNKFLLLLGTDDIDEDIDDDGVATEPTEDLVTGDISSLNALASQGNPRSLHLVGEFGSHRFHVLIDSGSTHNFINRLWWSVWPPYSANT
ncbi:hypothetical protein CK203_083170 [Vitis vinifera]|uniref:Retrotransposon gag domain-containing protein n=1 Tax=Vitis vinifera TaxID=29760 RepID=A0A438DWK0_VITVI|nr:hypothetical protein CK203_083170 [Vitis vinifera]